MIARLGPRFSLPTRSKYHRFGVACL